LQVLSRVLLFAFSFGSNKVARAEYLEYLIHHGDKQYHFASLAEEQFTKQRKAAIFSLCVQAC
jgi:hypothetical protein